ncbi:MAG: EAL domain-containing protein [Gammaproteobacteria bacterium]|nr:EAL domain-containing protein [Gammaproteobacteria bacterium]MDX5375189.1 EAL domain-containing protein [Gammaproteobacteria bacterium]
MIFKTRPTLVLGFGFIIVLAGALMVAWITVTNATVQQLDAVVNSYNLKRQLLTDMRTIARERTVSLQKMLILDDPFARDEEYLRFNRLGTDFVLARERYLALELSTDERNLLDSQDAIIGRIGPLQSRIVELIMAERRDAARALLLNEAIPLQDEGFQHLSIVLKYQSDAAGLAHEEAHEQHRQALIFVITLVAGIVLLSTGVALFIIRRTTENEQAIQKARERAEITLYSIGDGVITTDDRGRVEQINASAQTLTGHREEDARGRFVNDIIHFVREADHAPIPNPAVMAMDRSRTVTADADVLFVRGDGREFAVEYTASPIFDGHRRASGAILVFRDVTESRALTHQIAYQARHDGLTGLHNRNEFERHVDDLLSELRRYPDGVHWLCFADLDQFKVVNDTCGHLAGDELLKQVASVFRLYLRDSDFVARTGGDEFALVLRHCDEEGARSVIERIRHDLAEYRFSWEDKAFTIGASFGLVPITGDSGTLYDLLSAADTACYSAKDQGRNRIHVYRPDDDAISRREGEMHWVHEITSALEEDRFELYAQRIVPADPARDIPLHVEVLVRMTARSGGLSPPMAFIPAAERYNLMHLIDRWVVRNSLRQFAGYRAQGDWQIGINLSAHSLCDDDFLQFLLAEVADADLSPEHLCFEITETAAIANLTRAIAFMRRMKALGCRFSLDDFGSGLSSFGYLKTLPVDYLKIDGSFVRDIGEDPIDLALVESINQIGHILGIETIAEYVETDEIRRQLEQIGVDYLQGYGIARPEPLARLLNRRD